MQNDMRDRLIKLLQSVPAEHDGCRGVGRIADHLINNGVIVPSCKVGDTVHELRIYVYDNECRRCEHYLIDGFGDPSECNRTSDGTKHPDCIQIVENTISTMEEVLHWLAFNSFGKTVFLTREEAEQALKERESNE